MKKLLSVLFALVAISLVYTAEAQIMTPSPSPSCKVEQKVGLTDVHIEYSRPSMKGRTIFGNLVPYGKRWRTGANAATKITFSKDVMIGGKELKAGTYALFTTPAAANWDFHFFTHTTNNAGGYGEATPVLTVSTTPEKTGMNVESFLINIDNLRDDSATLSIIWANTRASVEIGVHTEKEAMASIEKTLAGPTSGDYYNAGTYLSSKGKDLDKALMYIQKATKGDSPRFWQVKNEAEVLAKLGRHTEAIKVAKQSLALATEAGNGDYIKMNKDNIAKWAKM